MSCHLCEQDPCTCQKTLVVQSMPPKWLIQDCLSPGCHVVIRTPIAQPLKHPICKWCAQGVSRVMKPKTWADGMPDPELPWPWMTDEDRERKLRTPFWKERLQRYPQAYRAWLRT